jgi:hypothetical protein
VIEIKKTETEETKMLKTLKGYAWLNEKNTEVCQK